MTIKKLFRSAFALTIFLLAGISCDNEDVPSSATGIIALTEQSVMGYELSTLTVTDYALVNSEYEIEIGQKKVKAAKNPDGSLSFMAPGDVPSGVYILKAPFAKNTLEINITAPAVISDPAVYVNDLIGDPLDDEKLYLEITGVATASQEVLAAKAMLQEALQKFNTLSAGDKQIAAQFLKANEAFFIDAADVINEFKDLELRSASDGVRKGNAENTARSANTKDWDDCEAWYCHALSSLVKVGGVILLSKTSVATAVVVGLDIGLSFIAGKKSITLSILLSVAGKALEMAYWAPNWAINAVLDKAQQEITTGLRTQAGPINILKGEKFTFKPALQFRTLNATDVNSPSPLIKEAITILEKAKAFYVNTLGSPAGPFPNYVSRTVTGKAAALSQWEVKSSNPLVTVSAPAGTVNEFFVTFNAAGNEKLSFTFSITYRNAVEEVTKTFDALLIPQRQPDRIEIQSGNNQSAQAGTRLGKPLKVMVKDINGKVLEGVKVAWAVKSGGGALSGVESLSDVNGIAQVEWTLGNSGSQQQVEAVVKKSDGTQVGGSPIQFLASALSECELGIITAPVITGYEVVCSSSNEISVLVSFTANGPGVLANGSYFGSCELTDKCYPVRLLFFSPGAAGFAIAANGYRATLKSGNVNAGTVEIVISKSCIAGKSARQSLDLYYPNYQWKIELMNNCNQRSSQITL